MTDLETALKAQIAEWRERAKIDAAMGAYDAADRSNRCANDLETLLDEHTEMDPEVKELVETMEDAT